MHMECSATKSSSRAHRRFSLHGQNTTPSVSFFSRGSFRPKKYFPTARFESYLLSTLPSLPLFLSFSLSPSLLKFAHEFISRSTGWRTRNPGSPVCVCVGFGAGSILISIQSRTISSGSTFEENERENEGSCPTLQPSLFPLLCRLAERCDFWIFRVWEKLCKPTHPTIASMESGGIFVVRVKYESRKGVRRFLLSLINNYLLEYSKQLEI